METVSLAALIEQATAEPGTGFASGNVRSFEVLFREESLAALERAHPGIFAFLAFHPGVDEPVADYVREGTLGSDSGMHILVLYTDDATLKTPGPTISVGGVEIDSRTHPAYETARLLFHPQAPPPLPGIIFVDRFTGEGRAQYSSLEGLVDASEVRGRLRSLFTMAENALGPDQNRDTFSRSFDTMLREARMPYETSGRAPLRTWLSMSHQNAAQCGSDMVTAIGGLG
ncbi:hypothetical protein ACFQ60_17700 [Streptomyces zhihengii]|uniref:Uncharacterized protein n=1 Tax=Streptomyces zhihengii TaxID=1818004 RepID=A0ABS2UWI8_9ACTN|nr:hypothetical protein [Streptomyces zhihengii]MBM9621820.1 hypothetical protein [Streptomyces zhihengii]